MLQVELTLARNFVEGCVIHQVETGKLIYVAHASSGKVGVVDSRELR
jgi:N-acetylmuramic acid 6-phosphate (MurNAc-6-P) etherase